MEECFQASGKELYFKYSISQQPPAYASSGQSDARNIRPPTDLGNVAHTWASQGSAPGEDGWRVVLEKEMRVPSTGKI